MREQEDAGEEAEIIGAPQAGGVEREGYGGVEDVVVDGEVVGAVEEAEWGEGGLGSLGMGVGVGGGGGFVFDSGLLFRGWFFFGGRLLLDGGCLFSCGLCFQGGLFLHGRVLLDGGILLEDWIFLDLRRRFLFG